jgi:hypothetical protein
MMVFGVKEGDIEGKGHKLSDQEGGKHIKEEDEEIPMECTLAFCWAEFK